MSIYTLSVYTYNIYMYDYYHSLLVINFGIIYCIKFFLIIIIRHANNYCSSFAEFLEVNIPFACAFYSRATTFAEN